MSPMSEQPLETLPARFTIGEHRAIRDQVNTLFPGWRTTIHVREYGEVALIERPANTDRRWSVQFMIVACHGGCAFIDIAERSGGTGRTVGEVLQLMTLHVIGLCEVAQ